MYLILIALIAATPTEKPVEAITVIKPNQDTVIITTCLGDVFNGPRLVQKQAGHGKQMIIYADDCKKA